MPYIVVPPPKTDEELAKEGKKIVDTAEKLGRKVDIEGFLRGWVSGIRVIAETDNAGNYTGIAFCAIGDRWIYNDSAVTVLYHSMQDRDAFLSFITTIGQAMGASWLVFEDEKIEDTPQQVAWKVVEKAL